MIDTKIEYLNYMNKKQAFGKNTNFQNYSKQQKEMTLVLN